MYVHVIFYSCTFSPSVNVQALYFCQFGHNFLKIPALVAGVVIKYKRQIFFLYERDLRCTRIQF